MVAVGAVAVLIIIRLQQSLAGRGREAIRFPAGSPILLTPSFNSWWKGTGGSGRLSSLLASVAAPVVEETMFRGVLYRHLREATRGAALAWSIVGGALIVSFVLPRP